MTALAGLTIPNEAAAGNPSQAELHEFDVQQVAAGFNLTGVLSGCAVTAQGSPDQTVAVAAGTVLVEGQLVGVTAGNVSMAAADGTNPRYDLVTVDTSGTKDKVDGTAAANPVKPDVPDNKVVIAEVYRAASDNAIATGEIVDKRILVSKRLPLLVPKTADETLSASTTLQSDDHLLLPVVTSGDIWFFEAFLFVHATIAAMDFKAGWSVPSGTTMLWGGASAQTSAGGSSTAGFTGITAASALVGPLLIESSSQAYGAAGASQNFGIALAGLITVGGTAGNVALQWAQNTSDAGTLTVKKGSFLRLTPIVLA